MPTYSLMGFPRTKSAEEFEDMCTDILSDQYKEEFSRYGRNGQKQDGIDIYCEIEKNKCIVAQCKNYYSVDSAKKLISSINNDIQLAATQSPLNIVNFIAMTSMSRDKNVQDAFIGVESKFNVKIMFWEDIEMIISSNNLMINRYYPNFINQFNINIQTLNHIISIINGLKDIAQIINSSYNNYRVACNYDNDVYLYKKLFIPMYNCFIELSEIKNSWCVQLNKLNIIENIEYIIKSQPISYRDEFVISLSEYIEYFSNDDNAKEFVNNCDVAIKKLSEHGIDIE